MLIGCTLHDLQHETYVLYLVYETENFYHLAEYDIRSMHMDAGAITIPETEYNTRNTLFTSSTTSFATSYWSSITLFVAFP
ncbi:hypothetical protein BJ912DRAFT_1010582 [Pholiota molesta]|nr:hypothetical protein BJ912DRAFT_1010582 [Pholiota molesta]